jgi:hypothetical protein
MIPKSIANFDAAALRREVEEELQFHVDMCAREYESQGLSAEEATARAKNRLGDVSSVKGQCVQIKARTNARIRAMLILSSTLLTLGIFIHFSTSDYRVARTGTVLIMIAVLGTLLTFVKSLSVLHLVSEKKPVRLGLHSDIQSD